MDEYDLIADWYARDRVGPTGMPEAAALAASLTPGSRVLDIGCGNGIPITRILSEAGHDVIGLDSSRQMAARFRANLPQTPVVRGRVETCPFVADAFDAAISWGVLFHLTHEQQAEAFAGVARVLRPGAPFLFTAGDVGGGGSIEGTMNGVVFRYFSFAIDDYRGLLAAHGLSLINVHADIGSNTYYFARKSP